MSVVALARSVREDILQEQHGVEQGILRGMQTWDEYQTAVGKRLGLEIALRILDETVQRMTDD